MATGYLVVPAAGRKVMMALGWSWAAVAGLEPSSSCSLSSATTATGMEVSFRRWVRLT